MTELAANGVALSGPNGFQGGGGLQASFGIAIDAAGHIWVTIQPSNGGDSGLGSLTELAADGTVLSGPDGI